MVEESIVQNTIFKNFINNEWVESSSQKTLSSISPMNKHEVVGQVAASDVQDLEKAIQSAHEAKIQWRKLGQHARGQFLFKVADILESRLDEIAETMTKEMGKTLPEAKGETARGVAILRYYAGEGMRKNGDVIPSSDSEALMLTRRVPVGVVGIITPWNFPVAIPIWKLAPALVYGNTVVFKPATEAAVTAAKVMECFSEANLPKGVLNFITGSGSVIGQGIIDHPGIEAITFTGSETIGREVLKAAAAKGIKSQVEMGGKNPVIVTKDADIEKAVEGTISGAFRSTGQKCTATSKVIVEAPIYEAFKEKLLEETKKIKVGNGLQADVWMGPCASESQFNTVKEYINIGQEEGATLLLGGEVLDQQEYKDGFYVSPAIFDNVQPSMRIAQEEIFGPVIALIKVADIQEAIDVANDTKYGLSASIYTQNISSFLKFADEIEAGLVRINAESAGVELQAPFGGMKQSGVGSREQGEAAQEFYTEVKTIFIKE
ncbi:alpha-ketoglutaric semialdehyde dehydrogenase GucD [Lysinibacillus sp. FSL K6-0232]|uniref:alpha-ketoglutaric semialdehyde dehydrogenase GucD n=1 Tax=Lysinibacillus sp. FSL K6-0232 TaxID=2921425 RepID=UPI0030F5DE1A